MDKEPDSSGKQAISKEAFGILAFLLGAFGVHDFAAKRYSYGFGHLALTFLAIVLFSSSQSSFLPPTLILGSWVWAIVENNAYQKSSGNTAATQKDETRGHLAFAKTAEVFLCLAILSGIATIVMTIQSRSWVCKDTSCGWSKAFVTLLLIAIFILMTVLSAAFAGTTLSRRKDLSDAQKQTKNVLCHTNAIIVLGIILISTIVLVILALAKII